MSVNFQIPERSTGIFPVHPKRGERHFIGLIDGELIALCKTKMKCMIEVSKEQESRNHLLKLQQEFKMGDKK